MERSPFKSIYGLWRAGLQAARCSPASILGPPCASAVFDPKRAKTAVAHGPGRASLPNGTGRPDYVQSCRSVLVELGCHLRRSGGVVGRGKDGGIDRCHHGAKGREAAGRDMLPGLPAVELSDLFDGEVARSV